MLMTNSMIQYTATFEATENNPMIVSIGHGENADLIASFKDGGIPVNLSGYTARAIYQPESKWGTDVWYECPCEISNNTAIAHWGNTYDNGDNAVKLFLHLSKNGKVAYPAIYKIGLFATPGFTPSAITPIPETIDFSQYTLLNAPWTLQTDFNSLSTAIGDPELIVRRNQDEIGNNGDIRSILLTGDDDDNPYLEFDDTNRGGDHWFIGTTGDYTGEEEHNICLPNGDGTLVLDGDLPYTKLSHDILFQMSEFTLTNRSVTGFIVKSAMNKMSLILNWPTKTNESEIIDCICDIDNSINLWTMNLMLSHDYMFVVDDDLTSVVDMLTIEAGSLYRYHFGESGFTLDNKPVIYVKRTKLKNMNY